MRAYMSCWALRAKTEMQYRAAAVAGVATQIAFGLILVLSLEALHKSNGSGDFALTATYVWIQQLCFRLVLGGDSRLREAIMSGDIAYELCRPVDAYFYWYAHGLGIKVVGFFMRAAVGLPIMLLLLPRDLSIAPPASLAAGLCALVCLMMGVLIVGAVDAISHAIIMITLDFRGIASIFSTMTLFFSGNIVPLTLFPDSWQHALRLQPFAQTLDIPIRLYTGQVQTSALPETLTVQAFWLLALLLIGRYLWARNMKKIVVQGG